MTSKSDEVAAGAVGGAVEAPTTSMASPAAATAPPTLRLTMNVHRAQPTIAALTPTNSSANPRTANPTGSPPRDTGYGATR
jgi:hypothetical protein